MRLILAAVVAIAILVPAGIFAAEGPSTQGGESAWEQYQDLRDDSNKLVGEGTAKLGEHDGSLVLAVQVAKAQARESLAQAMHMKISVAVSVTQSSSTDGSGAVIQDKDIKVKTLTDYPNPGEVTVLASVGEQSSQGTAKLSDHDGDPAKAEKAAFLAARKGLSTSGQKSSRGESSSEAIEVNVQGASQNELRELNIRVFDNFPKKDEVTVLAWVDRGEYLRLQGLEQSVPHWGYRVWGGADSLEEGNNSSEAGGAGGGLDVSWGSWVAGLSYMDFSWGAQTAATYGTGGRENPTPFLHGGGDLIQAGVGYDWAPWRIRVQPFIPIRLKFDHLSVSPATDSGGTASPINPVSPDVNLFGASAGLGLRYWPTDWFALDLRLCYQQGLNGNYTNSVPGTFSMTGLHASIGVVFSEY